MKGKQQQQQYDLLIFRHVIREYLMWPRISIGFDSPTSCQDFSTSIFVEVKNVHEKRECARHEIERDRGTERQQHPS